MRDNGMDASAKSGATAFAPISHPNKANQKLSPRESDPLKQLLAAIARQNRNAFRQLYDATAPKLFGYALRMLKKRELAEEVLQESFISIWNNAASYQSSLAAPLTWMTTIVRNKAFDVLRRTEDTIEIDAPSFLEGDMQTMLDSIEGTTPTPNEALQLSENATALAGCLKHLEGLHRQAIAMAFFHDLSHGEVAEQLRLPVGTVKTWIRRGLERLRLCLSKMERA
jgi:RNA polymerase sigma factor (sigma-70 family)